MSWLDALGWAGSALLIYSLLQARVLRFRVLNLVASCVLVVVQRAARHLADGGDERRPGRHQRVVHPQAAARAARRARRTRCSRSAPTTRTCSTCCRCTATTSAGSSRRSRATAHGRRPDGVPGAARRRDGRRRARARRGRRGRAGRARLRHAAVPRLHARRVRLPAQRAVPGPRLPAGADAAGDGRAVLRAARLPPRRRPLRPGPRARADRHRPAVRRSRSRPRRRLERRRRQQPRRTGCAAARAPASSSAVDVRAGRSDAERERLPPVVDVANGTEIVSDVASTSVRPAASHSSARWPARAPASPDSSAACGSRSCTACQNDAQRPAAAGVVPHAGRDEPPGRVTRAISRSPATGSAMKCTTSWARARSKLSSG